jgi:NhaA family Na+:H+ antiporter
MTAFWLSGENCHPIRMEIIPSPDEREDSRPVRSFSAVEEFIKSESAGAILLLIATIFALIWANSSYSASYFAFWSYPIGWNVGGVSFATDLHHCINDGLMSLFFFVVGLEIKREMKKGELSSTGRAALPAIAALGGMLVPAAIYFLLNRHGEAARGWAIPMATDIGFAIGVLGLLGKRIPSSLRIFLLALAIVDDVGAILVIALFYTDYISAGAIGVAVALLAVLFVLSRWVPKTAIFLIFGVAFWVAILMSGVHATIAGVILGLVTPLKPQYEASEMISHARRLLDKLHFALQDRQDETAEVTLRELQALAHGTESMGERLEESLHPWVSFMILPLFALANAGVALSISELGAAMRSQSAIGIFLGLVVGKIIGVVGFSFLAVKFRFATMAEDTNWHHFIGAGMLAGIGFTVALFVSTLAFENDELESTAKIAIMIASLVSGVLGYIYLRLTHRFARR